MPEPYFLRLLWVFWTAYQHTRKGGVAYVASDCMGVPDMACFFGLGRDAHLVQEASHAVMISENERIDGRQTQILP